MVTLLTAFGPQHSQLESAVCAAVSKPIASHPPGAPQGGVPGQSALRFCACRRRCPCLVTAIIVNIPFKQVFVRMGDSRSMRRLPDSWPSA